MNYVKPRCRVVAAKSHRLCQDMSQRRDNIEPVTRLAFSSPARNMASRPVSFDVFATGSGPRQARSGNWRTRATVPADSSNVTSPAIGEKSMSTTSRKTSARSPRGFGCCRRTHCRTGKSFGSSPRPIAVRQRFSCHRNIDGYQTGTFLCLFSYCGVGRFQAEG